MRIGTYKLLPSELHSKMAVPSMRLRYVYQVRAEVCVHSNLGYYLERERNGLLHPLIIHFLRWLRGAHQPVPRRRQSDRLLHEDLEEVNRQYSSFWGVQVWHFATQGKDTCTLWLHSQDLQAHRWHQDWIKLRSFPKAVWKETWRGQTWSRAKKGVRATWRSDLRL